MRHAPRVFVAVLFATSKRFAGHAHILATTPTTSRTPKPTPLHSHYFVAPFHLIAGLRGPAAITMFSSENPGRLSGGGHRAKSSF